MTDLTPAEIIRQKGGPAAFAKALNATPGAVPVSPGAVRMMKLRDQFPRAVWPEIMRAVPEISLDDLTEMEAAAKAVAA